MSTALVVVAWTIVATAVTNSVWNKDVPTTTKAVDIVLAALLLLGSVVGAQVGARFATKFRPEYLRLGLAVMVLLVGTRILLGLVWRPEEIFSVALS